MLDYLLKRLVVACGLIFAAVTLVFLVIHMVPGDPAESLLSQGSSAPSPEAVAQLREKLGLDRPLMTQYVDFLGNAVTGDFGTSMRDGRPVAGEIWLRLPRTLELIAAAGLLAVIFGIPAGMWAALHPRHLVARAMSVLSGFALAVPVFVSGTLLILAFALKLPVLPSGGFVPLSSNPLAHFQYLILPAVTIGIGLVAMVFQMTFSAVSEVRRQEYILAARARGIPARGIARKHILPNAMIPVVTVLALQLGTLLGGTVLVEYVFNWPGLSGYLVSAVEARDYPEVLGIVLVISVFVVFINLIVDLLYGILDPRVRRRA